MTLKFPYEGNVYISSPYGYRIIKGEKQWHGGLDLVGQNSKTILAPCDGVVVSSTMIPKESGNLTWEWGNYVCIAAEGLRIYMCHMAERLVSAGEVVKAGQPVGREGNTGASQGNHCHFEIRRNNVDISPYSLLGIPAKAGVTYFNTFKEDNMTKEEFKKLLDECGPEIYKLLVEYLAQQSESTWSKSEGYFRKATKSGIMDGMNPRGFVTREQIAAILGRMGLIV